MASDLYPLSDKIRARLEREAVSAEPYEAEEDEFILDGDSAKASATNARAALREDDRVKKYLKKR